MTWKPIRDVLAQSSVRIIVALGAMFIILGGTVDLSAGRQLGMYSLISGSLLQTYEARNKFQSLINEPPIFVALMIVLASACLIGYLNGSTVTYLKLPAFIATLGMQFTILGVASIYYAKLPNGSQPLAGFMENYKALGRNSFFEMKDGIPYILGIALGFAVLCHLVLTYTRFGKNVFALGGNREAARVSGIKVDKLTRIVYVIAACFYAMAAFLEVPRTGGATQNYGLGYEFDAIVSCVIGGVSIGGGVGAVPGVLIGVIMFQTITYGLTFMGIMPFWQFVVRGVVIVAAVAIDIQKYQKKT
jgi:methyl-galactoside transport system permease protein